MLQDLKEEAMYEDMGNFRKVMESIKNGNAKNKKYNITKN